MSSRCFVEKEPEAVGRPRAVKPSPRNARGERARGLVVPQKATAWQSVAGERADAELLALVVGPQCAASQPLDLQLAQNRGPLPPIADGRLRATERLGSGIDSAEMAQHLVFCHSQRIAGAMLRVNRPPYVRGREDSSMPTVGARIVALRKAKGLSQPELARAVGISQPSMHNIETDKTKKLRGDTLAGLCAALGVTPEVILHGGGQNPEAMLYERELLIAWRAMTSEDQQHLLAVARAMRDRMVATRSSAARPAKVPAPATTR